MTVGRVFASCDSSLVLAERLIRFDGERSRWLGPPEMRALATELDRLRAENAQLRREKEENR
jgi:hypothetical protein